MRSSPMTNGMAIPSRLNPLFCAVLDRRSSRIGARLASELIVRWQLHEKAHHTGRLPYPSCIESQCEQVLCAGVPPPARNLSLASSSTQQEHDRLSERTGQCPRALLD